MRLLHSFHLGPKFKFSTFDDDSAPPFAILSHTWGRPADEVSYQEMLDGSGASKAGYDKIQRCAAVAARRGYEYFWVDTCCIDKTSSEELSQAINSMYAWYKKAAICYAYLSDVSSTFESPFGNLKDPTRSHFNKSAWFTRGWTLQELIAPANITFFSREWNRIGSKDTLGPLISEITGIQLEALRGADLRTFSISARMSWQAKRRTSRIEDLAYSLMGIFDINMPMLYGEREKSFIRLQEEIMKYSDDYSIFAWKDRNTLPGPRGLLATSPKHFLGSADIYSLGVWGQGKFSMTNKGLLIDLFLIPMQPDGPDALYRASLDCCVGDSFDITPGIFLKRISGGAYFPSPS